MRNVPAVLSVLAGLVVLALLAAAGGLVVADRQQQALSDARTAALAQAREHAETVLSYDHESLDGDFAAALAVSTGDFAKEYGRTSEAAVRPLATQTKATVTAEVVEAGLVEATRSRAVVLLFVNQTTTSTRADGPQTDLNRVRMTVVRDGGRWLVEQVDAL